MMKSSKIKSATATKKQSPKSVMKPSNGSMRISWLRSMNFKTNRRKLRAYATQSLLSCINKRVELLVVCQEVCLVVCPVVVCQAVVCQEEQAQELVELQDQPSKKLTKYFKHYCQMYSYLSNIL